MTDQPKPPEGLPEGWRKTWASADFLPDPGPGIVRNAIRALAAERKARDAAEARVRELEEAIIKGHPVDCAYVGATQSLQLQRDRDRAQVARLTEERDMARAKVGEVSRDNDRLRSVLFAYRANNYRLRALLEEAAKRLAQNDSAWARQPADCLGYDLETGHPYREELIAGNGRTQDRICAELDGSPEPRPLPETSAVESARRLLDELREQANDRVLAMAIAHVASTYIPSCDSVASAWIRRVRAWAEQTEGRS